MESLNKTQKRLLELLKARERIIKEELRHIDELLNIENPLTLEKMPLNKIAKEAIVEDVREFLNSLSATQRSVAQAIGIPQAILSMVKNYCPAYEKTIKDSHWLILKDISNHKIEMVGATRIKILSEDGLRFVDLNRPFAIPTPIPDPPLTMEEEALANEVIRPKKGADPVKEVTSVDDMQFFTEPSPAYSDIEMMDMLDRKLDRILTRISEIHKKVTALEKAIKGPVTIKFP